MDWASYKQLCDRPDVWSRWMLQQTRELLEAPLAAELEGVLGEAPLEKPAGHKGDAATDMFVLRLSRVRRRQIACAVLAARNAGRSTSGTGRRGLGGFVEAWLEYANWQENEKKRNS